MRLILCLIILCLQIPATPARAGAWLREKGDTFFSSTFTLNRDKDQSSSTYIEYGWREDLTLGLDLSFASSHLGYQSGAATVFMRMPLGTSDGPHKWAYEIGAGSAWVGDVMVPHVKVGLSWGRGIKIGERWGWAAVDSAVFWDVAEGRRAIKLDSTLGLNFNEVFGGMLQLYMAQGEGLSTTTFAPSLLIKPRGRNYRLQIGAERLVGDTGTTSLKLGLWREF